MAHTPPDITASPDGLIRRDVALSEQCRFKVGGPADYFAAVSSAQQLQLAIEFARERELRHFVYSGGSNLFFDDAGYRGLIVRVQGGEWELGERELPPLEVRTRERSSLRGGAGTSGTGFQPVKVVGAEPTLGPQCIESATHKLHSGASRGWLPTREVEGLADRSVRPTGPTPTVTVSSGYDLPMLVRELAAHDLGGAEFLGNIPGSVGGAVVGNAGCYGRAIAELLVEAEVFDTQSGKALIVQPEFFQFDYRHSALKDDPRYVVTGATLRLVPKPQSEVLAEVEGELNERLRKHPHFAACAGSFFKNPPNYPAWKVIADAGLTDARVGGALLHEKHANFLVNADGATSADILTLARQVHDGVRATLGLELEPEVRYVSPSGVAPLW